MIYYDQIDGRFVKEVEKNNAKNRYLPYIKGQEGVYVEKLLVAEYPTRYIDFAYTDFERVSGLVDRNRACFLDSNGFPNARLVAYTVPSDVYERIERRMMRGDGG